MAPFTITPNDPIRNFVLLTFATLGSGAFEVLSCKGYTLLPGDTAGTTLNYMPLEHFGFLVPRNKKVNILAMIFDHNQGSRQGLPR